VTYRLFQQQTEFLAQQNSFLNKKLNRVLKENEINSQALAVSLDQNRMLLDKVEKLEQRVQNLEAVNQQMNYRTATLQSTTASIRLNQKQQINSTQSYISALRNCSNPSQLLQNLPKNSSGNSLPSHTQNFTEATATNCSLPCSFPPTNSTGSATLHSTDSRVSTLPTLTFNLKGGGGTPHKRSGFECNTHPLCMVVH
jgi:hypothetical protein